MKYSLIAIGALCISTASAFEVAQQVPSVSSTALDASSRRSFLASQAAASFGVATALVNGVDIEPAAAFGGGLSKVNNQLKGYGLPTISVPDGFSPLLELYGKGNNRTPLLIQFAHPSDWVVTLPSQDVNGEDGTIQAGQYAAGDTATLYVMSDTKVEVGTYHNMTKKMELRTPWLESNFCLYFLLECCRRGEIILPGCYYESYQSEGE